MDQLVEILSKSFHTAEILHAKTAIELKEQVDRQWINMTFSKPINSLKTAEKRHHP